LVVSDGLLLPLLLLAPLLAAEGRFVLDEVTAGI
jgi:hypothetical protein